MKNKTIKNLVIGIFAVLLICGAAELIANLPVLRLPDEQRGTYPLHAVETICENVVMDGDGFLMADGAEEASITWKFDRTYLKKFRYDIDCRGLFDADLTVDTFNIYGRESTKNLTDNSPMLVPSSTVNINADATGITLHFTNAMMVGEVVPIRISEPTVVNEAYINWYRVAILFFLGMMVVLLYVFRSLFLDKLEYGFALIALTVGFSMLLSFPSLKVGWDEEAHFRAAYRLTALIKVDTMPEEIMGHMLAGEYGWPLNPPGSYEETKLLDEVQNSIWENEPDDLVFEGCTRQFATAGTIFQAGAIVIARVLNLPWSGFYFLGRLMNLLTYVLAMFWTIRILPVGKKVTTFIALMPNSLFLAVCFTYDIVVFAFSMLGLAIVLKEWFRDDRKVDTRLMLLAFMFFMWGCFSKQVYAPLILITWLIPGERFASKKQAYIIKGLAAASMLILFGSMVVMRLMGEGGTGDSRGGEEVNNGSQIQLILSQPFAYARLLIDRLYKTFYGYTIGGSVFRTLGHLPDAGFEHIIPMAAVATIMVDQENTEKFRKFDRAFMAILILGVASLVWTALYIQFNGVGATWIGGVQGRYYKPFLPLLYMLFGNRLIKVQTTQRRINGAVLGVCAWIMIGTVWQILAFFRF